MHEKRSRLLPDPLFAPYDMHRSSERPWRPMMPICMHASSQTRLDTVLLPPQPAAQNPTMIWCPPDLDATTRTPKRS